MGKYGALRRYRVRNSAKNEFSRIAGIRAIQMKGGSECIIVDNNTIKGFSVDKYAYIIYNGIGYSLNRNIDYVRSCGVENCVKREHIKAIYTPSKSDLEYINSYGKSMSREDLAKALCVPVDILMKGGVV